MLWCGVLLYTKLLLEKMFGYKEDKIFESLLIDDSDDTEIKWRDTHFLQYHALKKVGSGFPEYVYYNQSTKRYVQMRYVQMDSDYSRMNEDIFTYSKVFEAKQCDQSTFLGST